MKVLTLQNEKNIWTQIFPNFSDNHYVFVLPPVNILGDAYIALGFIKAFEDLTGLEVLVAASANHASHRKAILLHGIAAHKVAYIDFSSFRVIASLYTNGPFYRYLEGYPEKKLWASRVAKVIHPGFGTGDLEWASKGIQLFDLYRILLGLGPRAKFQHHVASHQDELQAEVLFSKHKLRRGRTVVVFPDANSIAGIEMEVVRSLVEEFQRCEFDVIVDSNKEEFSDIVPVTYIDLRLVVPFLNICGFAVITRSGMADITLQSAAQKLILYPNKMLQSVYSNIKEGRDIFELIISGSEDWAEVTRRFTRS